MTKKTKDIFETTGIPEGALSPQELLVKMAEASQAFEEANLYLKQYFKTYKKRNDIARTLIIARRFDLLTNESLRDHLVKIFEDPKYKPTKDDLDGFCFLETRVISQEYEERQVISKQKEKEFEMWQRQMSVYQSELRFQGIEMSVLERQP